MSDKASVDLVAQRAAFDALYRRVHGRLLASLERMLRNREQAEDIAATAFATAWQKRDQFRGQSSLATWLYAIGRNAAIGVLRAEQRRPTRSEAVDTESLGESDVSFKRLEQDDAAARVQTALGRLPDNAREILIDRYMNERSVREIAQDWRLHEGTVGSRLFAARQLLRDAWPDREATVADEPAEDRARSIADEALAKLAQQLKEGKGEALREYLAAMGRFHRYSWTNVLLIQTQRPTATRVAGYHTWKELGRSVRRGEKGIRIFAPIVTKARDSNGAQSTERQSPRAKDPEKLVGFRAAYVFDLEQTEGQPLPDISATKGDPKEFTDRLKEFVASRGIALSYDPSIAPADGVSTGGAIALRPGLSPAEEFSVLAHELAHEMLHRGPDRSEIPKLVRETQAEAVAYVVSRGVGLETGRAAADYIGLYNGDDKTLADSLAKIQEASSKILTEILPREPDRGATTRDSPRPSPDDTARHGSERAAPSQAPTPPNDLSMER